MKGRTARGLEDKEPYEDNLNLEQKKGEDPSSPIIGKKVETFHETSLLM